MQEYNSILLTNAEVRMVVRALERCIIAGDDLRGNDARKNRALADEILVQSLNLTNDGKGGAA